MQLVILLVIKLLIELWKKNSQQNNSEAVKSEYDKKIPKEKCMSPEKKTRNYWWFQIKIIKIIV